MATTRFKVVKIPYDDRYDVVITTPPYKGQRQGKSFKTKTEAREWGRRAVRTNPKPARARNGVRTHAANKARKNPGKLYQWQVFYADGGYAGTVEAGTERAALKKARYEYGSPREKMRVVRKHQTNPVRIAATRARNGVRTHAAKANAPVIVRGSPAHFADLKREIEYDGTPKGWKVVYYDASSRWIGEKTYRRKSEAAAAVRRVRSRANPARNGGGKPRKNPVRIAATMSGKSTGWMPAKAVRVRVVKGRRIVDVKK